MAGKMNRKLVLEDGSEFYGEGFGANCDRVCEIVFNTAMAGYQEIIYDPTNAAKLVLMTYPIIGNLGITDDDLDAKSPLIGAMAVRQLNESDGSYASNLEDILIENCIPGISGLDTRELTRHIRGKGRCFALITDAGSDVQHAVDEINRADKTQVSAADVSTKTKRYYRTSTRKFSVVVIDCGVKLSYIRLLNKFGCNVTVMPWNTDAQSIIDMKPDGVFISSGPGDPKSAHTVAETINLLKGKMPVFGMGLGCQLIAIAYGAKTADMPTAHRGCNHPVRNLITGKIETVSQNHGYMIDTATLEGTALELTHKNVIDSSCEGVMCEADKMFGVQYYPENVLESAQTDYMFTRFMTAMKEAKDNA